MVENLVRKMLNLPLNDGSKHQGEIINPFSFPSLFKQ